MKFLLILAQGLLFQIDLTGSFLTSKTNIQPLANSFGIYLTKDSFHFVSLNNSIILLKCGPHKKVLGSYLTISKPALWNKFDISLKVKKFKCGEFANVSFCVSILELAINSF